MGLKGLKTLQCTIRSSLEHSMKAEFKTYSAVTRSQETPSIPTETVKNLVKTVVKEDRSRSVVLFGMAEEDGEGEQQLTTKVADVLQDMGEKPRITVSD